MDDGRLVWGKRRLAAEALDIPMDAHVKKVLKTVQHCILESSKSNVFDVKCPACGKQGVNRMYFELADVLEGNFKSWVCEQCEKERSGEDLSS